MRKIMTWAVGPALGVMGIIALLMATPGLASAGNNVTTASVTVPSSMSFTDETPSITFTPPPALPGEAVNNAQDVTWVSSTNDPNGGSVTVIASGDFTGQQAGDTIPISDLSVNNTPFSESNLQYLEAVHIPQFTTTTGTDAYALLVPDVAPDTYTTTLTYIASAD